MDSMFKHLISIIYQSTGADKAISDDQRVRSSLKWDNKAVYERELQSRGMTYDDIKKPIAGAGEEADRAGKKMGDLERAFRRAAIVAPVWMAARATMTAFISGVQEGYKEMLQMNSALTSAKGVIKGYSGTAGEAVQDLEKRVYSLTKVTGDAHVNLVNIFTQFGRLGMDYETAWRGVEATSKFAMASQGDSAKISQVMSLAFKNLGKTINSTVPEAQSFDFQMAKIYKAWKNSGVSVDEYMDSLKRFIPTARYMNISLDETITLLSALSSDAITGSRAGAVLSTSFNKLLDNLPKIASELGVSVNPQINSTYEALKKVIDVTSRMSSLDNMPATSQQIFKEIFGGIRGGEAAKALMSMKGQLAELEKATLATYKGSQTVIAEYNSKLEATTMTAEHQMKIFRELRTEVFEGFLAGTFGAKNMGEALNNVINPAMDRLAKSSESVGKSINALFSKPFTGLGDMAKAARESARAGADTKKTPFEIDILNAYAGRYNATKTQDILNQLKGGGLDMNDIRNKQAIQKLEDITNIKKGKELRENITNNVTIQGAITTQDLKKALTEISNKVISSSNYMGDKDLKDFIANLAKSPAAKQQIAEQLREKM